jgi:hypothetical protein
MAYMGIGIHILIALFFAVHVVRTGRETYWLFILLSFPLLGSLVYFLTVYLPDSRLHHDVRRAAAATAKALDPKKELREARHAFDLTPTAQNQMRLAGAYLEAGDFEQAAGHFEACLQGPFASDPEIRLGAARARLQNGQGATAVSLLESIRKDTPDFRTEQTTLLLAKAYAQAGRNLDARNEFVAAANRFGSVESRIELAIWALGVGEKEIAVEQHREIERAMRHWNNYTRSLHKPLMRRLDAAFASSRKE